VPDNKKEIIKKRITRVIINPPLKEMKEKELNEVSKKLLGNYIKKAKNDIGNKAYELGHSTAKKKAGTESSRNDLMNKIQSRSKNVNKAVNKITQEDYNPIDGETNLKDDPDMAVSDPYVIIGDPDASISLKDVAFKIIKIRSCDDLG